MGSTSQPKLLVGLGNPLDQYSGTRHNVGREFIDYMASEAHVKFKKFRQVESFRLPDFFGILLGHPLLCVKLNCFMNLSGMPLKDIMHYESIEPSEILVIVDDFMLPLGTVRLRDAGSAGGHNGLKSVIQELGTEEFGRLRIGIGPVPFKEDPAEFVLKRFLKPEAEHMDELFPMIRQGLEPLFQYGWEKAMAGLNKHHL